MFRVIHNFNSRYFQKFFTVAWVIFGLTFLSQMNFSGLAFLFNLQPPAPDQPRLGIAVAELIRAALFGWIFFTIFWKPGTRSILPDKSIKRDSSTLFSILLQGTYIQFWSILIADIGRRIDAPTTQPVLPNWGLVIILLVVLFWTIYKVIQFRKQGALEKQKSESLPNLTTPAKALEKIRKYLSKAEQEELKSLLFEDTTITKLSIQKIAWIAFIFVVVAVLIEVAQEFLARF